jgi:peptidoglycan/xylan/chitin deacetylase (PgdA/CDA1 family)
MIAKRWRSTFRSSRFLTGSAIAHGVGAITLLSSPQSAAIVLSGLAMNHLAIASAGLLPRCRLLGPNMTKLPSAFTGTDLMALTFDDGPDPMLTPQVLDLLDQTNQKATFFCVGSRVDRFPDLAAEIRRRGHGLENHSYNHPSSFALRGPSAMLKQVALAQDSIERVTGHRPTLFRAPAGIRNIWLNCVLAEMKLSLVSWTRRGFDAVTRDSERVSARLIRKGLRDREIILLHDTVPLVLDVLPRLLENMDKRKLRSVALHRVFTSTNVRLV